MLSQIKKIFKTFPAIDKAWIYGSFARGDDRPDSDIDLAVKTDDSFSYFDLAEDSAYHRAKDQPESRYRIFRFFVLYVYARLV